MSKEDAMLKARARSPLLHFKDEPPAPRAMPKVIVATLDFPESWAPKTRAASRAMSIEMMIGLGFTNLRHLRDVKWLRRYYRRAPKAHRKHVVSLWARGAL